jgi:uncharacterized protein YerC
MSEFVCPKCGAPVWEDPGGGYGVVYVCSACEWEGPEWQARIDRGSGAMNTRADYIAAAEVIQQLPRDFRATRRRLGKSLRDVEEETGVAFTTISRLERGLNAGRGDTLVALLRWLARHAEVDQ